VIGDGSTTAESMGGYVLAGTRGGRTAIASPSYLRHELVHEINAANGYGLPMASWPNEHAADTIAMTSPGISNWTFGQDAADGALTLPISRDLERPAYPTRQSVVDGYRAFQAEHPTWPDDFFLDGQRHLIGGPASHAAVIAARTIGRDGVHDVWYRALLDAPATMKPWDPRFHPNLWAGATIDAARAIGLEEPGVQAVRDAWKAVDFTPKRVVDGYIVDLDS
jgi:Zn-dependent metalloprotease